MKGKQTALMPGNGDRVGYWLTPSDLWNPLNSEFHFDFDPCPYPRPSGFNGLVEDWGKRNWVNPPFVGPESSRVRWAQKMIAEQEKGNLSVMINSVDRWLVLLVQAGVEIRVPPPFKWKDRNGVPQEAPRPHLLFILRPKAPPSGGQPARSAREPSDSPAKSPPDKSDTSPP